MNFLFVPKNALFRLGLQRYALFFNLQTFLQKFFNLFFQRQSFVELMPLQTPFSQTGVQRYDFFHYFQIYFAPEMTTEQKIYGHG